MDKKKIEKHVTRNIRLQSHHVDERTSRDENWFSLAKRVTFLGAIEGSREAGENTSSSPRDFRVRVV